MLAVGVLLASGLAGVAGVAVLVADWPEAACAQGDADDRSPLEAPASPRFVACHVVVIDGDELVGVDGDDLGIEWRIDCPAAAWASPITSRNAEVDVATCDGRYVAVDGRSGEVLWRRPIDWPTDRVRVGPSSLVLQADGVGVTVIDLSTGEDRFDLDIRVPANLGVDEDHVYLATDNGIQAFDLDGGDLAWAVDEPAAGLIATGQGVFARTNQHWVLRLDPATGETERSSDARRPSELWSSDFVHTSDEIVVLRSTRGQDTTVPVYDASTLELLWSVDGGVYVAGAPGVVAMSDGAGRVLLHNSHSGERIGRLPHLGLGSPAMEEDRLYLVGFDESDFELELRGHDIG